MKYMHLPRFLSLWVLLSFMLIRCAERIRPVLNVEEKARLMQELSEIGALDQLYRNKATTLRSKNKGVRTEEEAELWRLQSAIDSTNMIRLEKIIATYGYPGAELVGEKLKTVGVFVILHNPKKQELYVNLLWNASKKGDVDKREVAILEDRVNMLKGVPQKFGTAMKYIPIGVDSLSGMPLTQLRIWDIKQFKNLDKNRESVGLYAFKLQCELEGIDWTQFKNYHPQPTKFDFPYK